MARSDWRDLAALLAPSSSGAALRMATVTGVDADGDALVRFPGANAEGADAPPVPVPCLASYTPRAGDVVAVLADASRFLILGSIR